MPLVEEVVACRRPAALLCADTPSRPCYLHHSVGTPLLARTASLGSLQGGARVRCWAGVALPLHALSGGPAACEMLSGARQELPIANAKAEVMTALGDNVHIFARPHRRQGLIWCFDTVLGCGPVATVQHPGMNEPIPLVRFPGGGTLSIEFIEEALDDDTPRLGAWLELRTQNPEALMQAALDAGLTQVQHPGHPYYFMAPGGQVFTIAPQT